MKKILTMILTLGWLVSLSQSTKYPPVREYNEGGYSVQDLKDFSLKEDPYTNNFYQALLGIINEGLKTSQYDQQIEDYPLVAGRSDEFIFKHISIKDGVVFEGGFVNSYKNGNQVSFFWDKKPFRGSAFVFVFNGCEIILAKIICMNLIKGKMEFIPLPKKEKGTEPTSTKPTVGGSGLDFSAASVIKTTTSDPAPKVKPKPTKTKLFERTEVKVGCCVLGLGGLVAGIWCLVDSQHKPDSKPVTPPVPPVTDTGGPGGAPVTTGSGPGGSNTTGG